MTARHEAMFIDPASAQSELDKRQHQRRVHQAMLQAASKDHPGDSEWFVLSVTNRAELAIASAMEMENICAWVPQKTASYTRRKPRTNDPKLVPLFSGYLFVRVVPSASAFLGLLAFDHVHSILGTGEKPLPVKGEIINVLKELIECGCFDIKPRDMARRLLKPGDLVEINHGAMAFVEAVVEGYRGTRHVRCMAALFGGEVAVTIPLVKLRKID